MKDAESVTFGGSGLDRAAHLRRDPPQGGVLPVWRGKPLLEMETDARTPVFLPPDHPVFADARASIEEQIPTEAPQWIVERYEQLTGSCQPGSSAPAASESGASTN